jgi:hypothetical protein
MRPALDAWNVIGYAALLVTLLLSSPGVSVVRADESATSTLTSVVEGPTCEARQPIDDPELARVWSALREEAALQGEDPDPNVPIALNNRGYGYGPSSASSLDQIRAELEMVIRQP